jgi:transcriptional regulator with XRE-family HTH domain
MNQTHHRQYFDNYLEDRIKQLNISFAEAARRAGISRQTLYDLRDNAEKSQMLTLIKVANALEVHPFVLFRLIFDKLISKDFASSSAIHSRDATGFIADVTIPDGMVVFANAVFSKTWRIQNIGAVEWRDRELICMDEPIEFIHHASEFAAPKTQRGLLPTQTRIPIPLTLPGEQVDLTVEFTAPDYPGTIMSYWKMVDEKGRLTFPELEGVSCVVKVITI